VIADKTVLSAEGAAEGSQGQARSAQPLDRMRIRLRPGGPTEMGRAPCLSPVPGWRVYLADPGAACAAARRTRPWLPSVAPSARGPGSHPD